MKAHGLPRKHLLPSISELRQKYRYDPDTGEIFGPSGRAIGSVGVTGYVIVGLWLEGRSVFVRAHRLAFALTEGRWPHLIDHIDGDRSNNRWSNLRESTNRQNCFRARPGCTRNGNKWVAKVNGKRESFHCFGDIVRIHNGEEPTRVGVHRWNKPKIAVRRSKKQLEIPKLAAVPDQLELVQ